MRRRVVGSFKLAALHNSELAVVGSHQLLSQCRHLLSREELCICGEIHIYFLHIHDIKSPFYKI